MKLQKLKQEVENLNSFLVCFREDLHAHPEIGCCEYRTAAAIRDALMSFGIPESQLQTDIVHTGIIVTIKGDFPGPVILFRADMDALRGCDDVSGAPYASQNSHVCHACGHDVHTTVGVAAAKLLWEHRKELHGTAKIFFQPSEELPVRTDSKEQSAFSCYTESPYGVRAAGLARDEGLLHGVDRLLGLHCWPALEAGRVGYESRVAMAGSGNFHLQLRGRGGHAGMPQHSVDAIVLAAQVVMGLQTVVSRRISPSVPIVLNIGTIQGGMRRSSVAERVDLTGTVRCADRICLRDTVPTIMEQIIRGICDSTGGTYQFEYCAELPPVYNEPKVLAHDVSVLQAVFTDKVEKLDGCPMTAEDFSLLSEVCPGVFFKLGTRGESEQTQYPLHNGAFDVDKRCLKTGVLAISAIILHYLDALELNIPQQD